MKSWTRLYQSKSGILLLNFCAINGLSIKKNTIFRHKDVYKCTWDQNIQIVLVIYEHLGEAPLAPTAGRVPLGSNEEGGLQAYCMLSLMTPGTVAGYWLARKTAATPVTETKQWV